MNTHPNTLQPLESEQLRLQPSHPLEHSVADKIDQLLTRVANLKTADQLKPTKFDRRGEQHAREIARKENAQ